MRPPRSRMRRRRRLACVVTLSAPLTVMTPPAPLSLRSLASSPTAPPPEVAIVAEPSVIDEPEPSALTPKLLRPLLSALVPDVVIDTDAGPRDDAARARKNSDRAISCRRQAVCSGERDGRAGSGHRNRVRGVAARRHRHAVEAWPKRRFPTPTPDTPAPEVEIVVAERFSAPLVVGASALDRVGGRRRRARHDEAARRRDQSSPRRWRAGRRCRRR